MAGQVHHAAGVAHLVVVPGVHLQQGAVGHHGGQRVHDGAAGVACVIGAHQGPLLVAQDARQRPARGLREQGVHFLGGGRALQFEHAVGERRVEHRGPHGVAVELALELRVDQGDGRGAACGGGRQAQHGAAGAPQVLVGRVHHEVGVGGVVDGGDLAVADAQGLVHHFHHGRQAVGGARSGGHDGVLLRVVEVLVHTHHHVEHAAGLHRGRDDHALGATVQVALQRLGREELACALQHQIHAQVTPRDVGCGGVRAEAERARADAH